MSCFPSTSLFTSCIHTCSSLMTMMRCFVNKVKEIMKSLASFRGCTIKRLMYPLNLMDHNFVLGWKELLDVFWRSNKSHDSSVGTALGYGLDDRGSRVRFPAGAGNFSLHHRIQNGSGAHPTYCPMGTRGSFPGGKAVGVWSWPLTSI
jgi:hypothetical protein